MCCNPTPNQFNTIKKIMDTGTNVMVFHPQDTSIIKIPTKAVVNAQGPSGAKMASIGMVIKHKKTKELAT